MPEKNPPKSKYDRFSSWLNKRDHNTVFMSFIWLAILSLLFLIIYSNLGKLNEIKLLFIPLGSALLFINLVFWILYAYDALGQIIDWFGGERAWVKYFILLIILLLVWQAYQQRESLFDPVVGLVHQKQITLEKKLPTPEIENMVFKKTNEERKKSGLSELTWDSELAEIARMHSLDMANNSYLSHINLQGEDPVKRARKYGIDIETQKGSTIRVEFAENIGMMPTGYVEGYGLVYSSDAIAGAMVQDWMKSTDHRNSILNPDFRATGVGVAYEGNGTYYFTQNFK